MTKHDKALRQARQIMDSVAGEERARLRRLRSQICTAAIDIVFDGRPRPWRKPIAERWAPAVAAEVQRIRARRAAEAEAAAEAAAARTDIAVRNLARGIGVAACTGALTVAYMTRFWFVQDSGRRNVQKAFRAALVEAGGFSGKEVYPEVVDSWVHTHLPWSRR